MKRVIAALAAALTLVIAMAGYRWWDERRPWQQWLAFKRVFIQADGRVIDRTAGLRSTSEGQAYTLFFALAANDPVTFERVLHWTTDNLAAGDLTARLPAWLWGRGEDGSWGVLDANAASDADLWIAYTLLEAARLWQRPQLRTTGLALLAQIKAREVAEIPPLGAMLIPAPFGFQAENGDWRLNPSYLPEFQFRYLQQVEPDGPWGQLWRNHLLAMSRLVTAGVAPDWYRVTASGEIGADPVSGRVSSYDAIRVYLWAGMTEPEPGSANQLLGLLGGYRSVLAGREAPPEKLDFRDLSVSGGEPIGFSAAVLPFLARLDEDSVAKQRQRLKKGRADGNLGVPPHYYDQVLGLFGEGWSDGRFRFGVHGQVIPRWQQ